MLRAASAFAAVASLTVVPSAYPSSTLTLKLTSLSTVSQGTDAPPKNRWSPGDHVNFKDLLLASVAHQFGKKKGDPVGYDAGIVEYAGGTKQRMTVKVTFPGVGTLTYQGVLKDLPDGSSSVPITGGTGQFKGARGLVIIGEGSPKAPNTFKITTPKKVFLPGSGAA
jgi:hypothetical protein